MLLKTGGPVGAVEKVGPSPALILSTVFILVYEISGYIQVIMLMFPPVNLQCLLYSMKYLFIPMNVFDTVRDNQTQVGSHYTLAVVDLMFEQGLP